MEFIEIFQEGTISTGDVEVSKTVCVKYDTRGVKRVKCHICDFISLILGVYFRGFHWEEKKRKS